jgi:hypothetical protein
MPVRSWHSELNDPLADLRIVTSLMEKVMPNKGTVPTVTSLAIAQAKRQTFAPRFVPLLVLSVADSGVARGITCG